MPTNSQLPTRPNPTSPAIIELQGRFPGGATEVLSKFNPALQVQYCRDLDKVYFGKSPRISTIQAAYGRNVAESWLEVQLNDLSEFAGCKEKLRADQISELAAMILEDYPDFKLTEFMHFFQNFKRCKYGKFYGAVDPMAILQALSDFAAERRRRVLKKQESEKARLEAETSVYEADVDRYKRRVPGAFTDEEIISYPIYCAMGYSRLDDESFARELDEIQSGAKVIPSDVLNAYAIVKATFNPTLQ